MAKKTNSQLILQLFLPLALLLLRVRTAESQLSRALDSCAYNYTLRAEARCIYSSQDRYSSCKTFISYLESLKIPLRNSSDCLHLIMEPGVYKLDPSAKAIIILYDLYLSTTEQRGVIISYPTNSDDTNYLDLQFIKGQRAKGSIFMEGIEFEGSRKPIRFDELEVVTIKNCSFR